MKKQINFINTLFDNALQTKIQPTIIKTPTTPSPTDEPPSSPPPTLVEKWKESGILDDLTEIKEDDKVLDILKPNKQQKIK